jgi:hypothetical protein
MDVAGSPCAHTELRPSRISWRPASSCIQARCCIAVAGSRCRTARPQSSWDDPGDSRRYDLPRRHLLGCRPGPGALVRCRGQTLFSSQTAESPRCETGARWSSLPVAGSCVAAGAQDRVCLPRPVRSIARRVGHTPVATTVVRMVEVERLAWQHRLGTEVAGAAVGVGEQLCPEFVVVPAVTQRVCSQQAGD